MACDTQREAWAMADAALTESINTRAAAVVAAEDAKAAADAAAADAQAANVAVTEAAHTADQAYEDYISCVTGGQEQPTQPISRR